MPVIKLAIPTPLRKLFDYLPPDNSDAEALQPGVRLRVPFGKREVTGYLVEHGADSELDGKVLKTASALLDTEPLLPATMVRLCNWAAHYYQHPVGEVYQVAFARRLRQGEAHRSNTCSGWQLTTHGKGLPKGALARSPKQALALTMLQASPQVSTAAFREVDISAAILRTLEQKGLVSRCSIALASSAPKAGSPLTPSAEQANILQALASAPVGFSCHLLEGVTGSGKTEIYLRLIADCLAAGRQALVLIPEIGLTPQTLARFSRRFEANIAVLHSGLSDGKRYQAWEDARSGAADIVIGTRSAVFTPLARPGLTIVDEEHDQSFKQQDGFRYSARDVAVKRGQLEDALVILGSATPSLESLQNALQGRYSHHRMQQRAGGSQLPTMTAVDIRKAPLQAGLSPALIEAIEQSLQRRQQVLLFLNRRGYAPTLQCHDCGWIAQCTDCDARLTLHRQQRRLRCHHCSAVKPLVQRCPDCHGDQLMPLGLGTEQAQDWIRQRFAQWPLYRVDSDTMQGRESMQSLVDQINRGEPCILLGTQMLTKGHHFPAVSLVGIIDMDAMLFSTDFRGEERAAQLLTQVAGRAGRAETPGQVLLQTHHPEHPTLSAMLSQSYHDHALAMLEKRRQASMPPAGQLLLLRTDCSDAALGEQFLADLRRSSEGTLPDGINFIGPLPAPMQRRAGRFRSQLLVHTADRSLSQLAAQRLVQLAQQQRARKGLNWSLDVDPQELF